jgi:hypothetical protein
MTFPATHNATKPRSARSGRRRPWARQRVHGRAPRPRRSGAQRFPRTLIDWASVTWRPPITMRSTKRAVASPPKGTRPPRPAQMRRARPRRPRRAVARVQDCRSTTAPPPPAPAAAGGGVAPDGACRQREPGADPDSDSRSAPTSLGRAGPVAIAHPGVAQVETLIPCGRSPSSQVSPRELRRSSLRSPSCRCRGPP